MARDERPTIGGLPATSFLVDRHPWPAEAWERVAQDGPGQLWLARSDDNCAALHGAGTPAGGAFWCWVFPLDLPTGGAAIGRSWNGSIARYVLEGVLDADQGQVRAEDGSIRRGHAGSSAAGDGRGQQVYLTRIGTSPVPDLTERPWLHLPHDRMPTLLQSGASVADARAIFGALPGPRLRSLPR